MHNDVKVIEKRPEVKWKDKPAEVMGIRLSSKREAQKEGWGKFFDLRILETGQFKYDIHESQIEMV